MWLFSVISQPWETARLMEPSNQARPSLIRLPLRSPSRGARRNSIDLTHWGLQISQKINVRIVMSRFERYDFRLKSLVEPTIFATLLSEVAV
jgi:hypothetical protein